jgi:hypothetical protein
MSHRVEIESFLTPRLIEYAHGRAIRAQEMGREIVARTGMRAAKARDSRLLKVLDYGANHLDKMSDDQMGRTRRSTEVYSQSVQHTEAQLWREAYRFADKGEPLEQLQWIYGAAALACGFVD